MELIWEPDAFYCPELDLLDDDENRKLIGYIDHKNVDELVFIYCRDTINRYRQPMPDMTLEEAKAVVEAMIRLEG